MYIGQAGRGTLFALALLVGVLTGCQTGGGPAVFYAGDVRTTAEAEVGPLRFELWQVQYSPSATGRTATGVLTVTTGGTNVFVNVHNTGTHTALLYQPWVAQASPPPPPTAYLEDQLGRRYPATGSGWSQPSGDPEENIGKALPNKTAEAMLAFDAMPRDVTALTLHWEMRLDDGTPLTVTLPVPLPNTQSSSPGAD